MIDVQKDKLLEDNFSVTDSVGNPVAGLVDGNFTRTLFNPSGTEVSGTITVTITELGNGVYKASYTPNALGIWALTVYHATYFPWGKSETYRCIKIDLATLGQIEGGKWKIVGTQMIFYEDDNTTEIMRFDLYDKFGNPSDTNVFWREKV